MPFGRIAIPGTHPETSARNSVGMTGKGTGPQVSPVFAQDKFTPELHDETANPDALEEAGASGLRA